jgi:PPK2 family polyphosphate:nucleotide phosphotransferase
MKIELNEFRIETDAKVDLKKCPTSIKPLCKSEEAYATLLSQHVSELSTIQRLLYASHQHAVLVIFQGMDTSGKDGAIRHVMSGVNPQGVEVSSFKQPTPEELLHDFLWRTTCRLPEKGRIGIFNRSYYEEVLVTRVHPEILKKQNIPESALSDKDFWKDRYRSINDLEKHLHRNGTTVIKIFLHISRDEQEKRLLERIDDPNKNWKFSQADIQERQYWQEYRKAYESCIAATSTVHAPWFIVPADDKHDARFIVSEIILNALGKLDMKFPVVDADELKDLASIREQLIESSK